jgi:hypothetical protein
MLDTIFWRHHLSEFLMHQLFMCCDDSIEDAAASNNAAVVGDPKRRFLRGVFLAAVAGPDNIVARVTRWHNCWKDGDA